MRWNYLATCGYELHHNNHDQAKEQTFVKALFKMWKYLIPTPSSATNAFVERDIRRRVLIAWENEALFAINELNSKDQFEIVTPSESILAETDGVGDV